MADLPITDYSEDSLRVAEILVRRLYATAGYEPIGVQLALTKETENDVWRREARKLLLENYRRRQRGLRPINHTNIHKLQDVPVEWDELAGERPAEDEYVPTKQVYYQSGPIRMVLK